MTLKNIQKNYPKHDLSFTAICKSKNFTGAAAILPNKERTMLKLPAWISRETANKNLILEIFKSTSTKKQYIILTFLPNIVISIVNNNSKILLNNIIYSKLQEMKGDVLICYHSDSQGKYQETIDVANQAKYVHCGNHTPIATPEDIKQLITVRIKSKWNSLWISKTQNSNIRKCRSSIFSHNLALKFNRKDQVLITILRIGHSAATHPTTNFQK